MTTKDVNVVSMVIAILGALKIVLEAFGIDIIDDEQINQIANGAAAVITIVGVVISHRKTDQTVKVSDVQPYDVDNML